MLFTSIEFLLLFFPLVFSIYYLLPGRIKNGWLLLASLFFYAWGEPKFVLVMMSSVLANYVLALQIEKLSGKKGQRIVFVLAVALDLGLLGVFKYLNFVTVSLHHAFPAAKSLFRETSIALPIGISFFSFQELSYVIDVYRGIPAQKNPISLSLYISLFPQLIAGPIVRYTSVIDQIDKRSVTLDSFSQGLVRFFVGFNKKVLLANTLALVADKAFSGKSMSVCTAWLGAVSYTLQIYYDFSGYSDMAIGLGRMLGFTYMENFNYPYISKTVTEFWRRWHISLGSWFRDYVYIPMGGSRVKSRSRLVWNLMVVWCLTGIWHGANWTFILWGTLYGLVITAEKLLKIPGRINRWAPYFRRGYQVFTLLLVMLGWVLFRSDTLEHGFLYLKTMFGATNAAFYDDNFLFRAKEFSLYLIAGCLCATPVFKRLREGAFRRGNHLGGLAEGAHALIHFVLFIFSFSFLVMNAHDPFIYFNF